MILAYIFAFLMLFALLSNTFLQKYKVFKINESYFQEAYDPYLHRPSDIHLSGFGIKDLLDLNSPMRPLFIQTIQHTYQRANFYYELLGQDLLTFFEEQIEFNEAQSKINGKTYLENVNELKLLNLDKQSKRFKTAYFHLMEPSKISSDHPDGYLSLIELLHPVIVNKQSVLNLYQLRSEIVEVLFNSAVADDLKNSLLRFYLQPKENGAIFYKEFIERNRLQNHPNLKLVHFQVFDPELQ